MAWREVERVLVKVPRDLKRDCSGSFERLFVTWRHTCGALASGGSWMPPAVCGKCGRDV